jgi:hypothetical protein
MNRTAEYTRLKDILNELQKRAENCRKSPNTGFTQSFLRLRRDRTVEQKLESTKLLDLLAKRKKLKPDRQKLREKELLIKKAAKQILTFVGKRITRKKGSEFELTEFVKFQEILRREYYLDMETTHTSVCSQITFALHTHSLLQRIYTLCFVFALSLGLYTKTAEGSISDIDDCTFVHYKLD